MQDTPPATQAPAITSANATTFIRGAAGSFAVTSTSGAPTSRTSLTGPRPVWLTFVDHNDGTATLSGTPDATSAASYSFTITATNGVPPAASQSFTLTISQAITSTKPINISTRLSILTGDSIGIGGFIISGSVPKKVIIRCLGPTLTQFGVAGALQNPRLELHQGSTVMTSNDDWKSSQQALITASGYAPPNDRESAILITLQSGSYTIFATGSNNTTGVGLVEIYDLDPNANSKLGNISTRGSVQTADKVMIAGFILGGGANPATIVIRALGPTLTSFGVPQALLDPMLALYDKNGVLVSANDNWKQTQAAQILSTGLQPPNDLEAAILATLPVANYTAIVKGKNGGTGVGLVEVYTVP